MFSVVGSKCCTYLPRSSQFVTPGDCVVGRISRIVDGHAELNVLAFEKPKNREVWDLGIKVRSLLVNTEFAVFYSSMRESCVL